MSWQDIILSVGQWIFILALIPSILSKTEKPSLKTSLPTGIILIVYAGVYANLSLWISAVSVFMLALGWLVLAFQKYR